MILHPTVNYKIGYPTTRTKGQKLCKSGDKTKDAVQIKHKLLPYINIIYTIMFINVYIDI